MVNNENKFIFVHIPKTGGTSIENSLPRSVQIPMLNKVSTSAKHWTLKNYVLNNTFCSDYFTFSFVRNPWDMTVSMYHYLWESDHLWPRRWRKINQSFSKLSFSEWLKDEAFKSPVIRSIDVAKKGGANGSLLDWVEYGDHKLNFIGKFENLQEDFNIVCDKIGIPRQQLPHKNKSKHKHYTEYYDEETREIVEKKYAKDIEYFGYKFRK
tara:strand:- start:1405 stop:2034 length:630 start_codon:yes stop_codon:yes gene_type:complete